MEKMSKFHMEKWKIACINYEDIQRVIMRYNYNMRAQATQPLEATL